MSQSEFDVELLKAVSLVGDDGKGWQFQLPEGEREEAMRVFIADASTRTALLKNLQVIEVTGQEERFGDECAVVVRGAEACYKLFLATYDAREELGDNVPAPNLMYLRYSAETQDEVDTFDGQKAAETFGVGRFYKAALAADMASGVWYGNDQIAAHLDIRNFLEEQFVFNRAQDAIIRIEGDAAFLAFSLPSDWEMMVALLKGLGTRSDHAGVAPVETHITQADGCIQCALQFDTRDIKEALGYGEPESVVAMR